MVRHACIGAVVVAVRRVHEHHAALAQRLHGRVDVVGAQREMLDAFAAVVADEFGDLGLVVRAFVDRDAQLAAGAGHGPRDEAGELAFDVEVADLAEVADSLVEAGPDVHVALGDVVREVVELLEADALRLLLGTGDRHEVDVVDRAARAIAVDEVQHAVADAVDGRQIQLHEAGPRVERHRALRDGMTERGRRIGHAPAHRAGARAMRDRELREVRVRRAVDEEVDVALSEQRDVLAAMARDGREAEQFEQRMQLLHACARRRRELDELEAVGLQRIKRGLRHRKLQDWKALPPGGALEGGQAARREPGAGSSFGGYSGACRPSRLACSTQAMRSICVSRLSSASDSIT